MILPDVNLLVYAYNTDAPWHPQAKRWWETCLDGSQPVAIAWVVALGFLRLMTSRAVMQRPMAMEVAIQHLGRWLERPSVLILQPGLRWVPFTGQFWPLTSLTPGGRNMARSQYRPHGEFCLPGSCVALHGSTSIGNGPG